MSTLGGPYLTMRPPAPRSTLFPYTTLFRSLHNLLESRRSVPVFGMNLGTVGFLMNDWRRERLDERLARAKPFKDRKSTRLNSSHVASSYAVFCSKNKTVQATPIIEQRSRP